MYDPTYPPTNALIESAPLRAQFNGLKTLIDAVQGGGISSVVVDGVTTLPPGSAATVGLLLSGSVLHFTFGLPQGQTGNEGPQGLAGPPFANAVVDGVSTLPTGSNATVSVSFDGVNVRFAFGIPQGADGIPGGQGPMGEVSLADLNAGMASTLGQSSNNSNSVNTLGLSITDPPIQVEVQSIANKLDELILALRR